MHDDFLTALRASPNDNTLRLVYADWLQEHDDPLEEFVRLEVQLFSGALPEADRVALTNRLAELGRRAERGWLMAINRVPFVRCGLRKVSGGSPLVGKLDLVNYATRPLLVTFDRSVLQHLRFTITSPLGEVSDGLYAEILTGGRVRQHRFSHGEVFSGGVNLLNPLPVDQITVGAYMVEAVYDYDGVQSRADPVRVELTDDDRRKWKLGRYARE